MPFDVHGALLVAVVAGVTALIRFLPFVVLVSTNGCLRMILISSSDKYPLFTFSKRIL